MAVSMQSKAFSAARVGVRTAPPRAASVVVRAEKGNGQSLQLAAAALFSAAALLSAVPSAEAKGVQVAQPVLKKNQLIFDNSAPVTKEARKAQAASMMSAPSIKLPDFQAPSAFDLRFLLLPGSIGAIGALGFLASKVDPGFSEWFDTASCKNNINDGVGYEPIIKLNIDLPPGQAPSVIGKNGKITTKKVTTIKGAPAAAEKKGLFDFLGGDK